MIPMLIAAEDLIGFFSYLTPYIIQPAMTREHMIDQLEAYTKEWDICIIGGGATGLGTAIDAASRGYKTLLVEQCDFAKGTSSRSTKLVHGGVRYLQQGNIKLVTEALKERGLLRQNAPPPRKKPILYRAQLNGGKALFTASGSNIRLDGGKPGPWPLAPAR